jgi:Flp pilus assembly protein TadD
MSGQAFEQKHMYDEAGRDFSKAVKLSGQRSMVVASFGHFLAVSGDRRGAQKVLAELNALSQQRYVPAYEKGLVHVGIGDNEAALQDLKQAYKEGSHWMFILQTDARLDPLRPDPRFQQLVRRVRLPQ